MGLQIVESLIVSGATLGSLPRGLQHTSGLIEVLGHGAHILILQVGELTDVARIALTEEHILNTVIAQQARVEESDFVLDIRHDALIAQHVGEGRLIYRPGVGVRIDGVFVGSTKEEGLRLLPVGTGHAPLLASRIKRLLTACHHFGLHVVF